MVPLDFSEANRPVVEKANLWAERTEYELHFMHVLIPVDYSYFGAETSLGIGKAELEMTEEQGMEAMDNFLAPMKITVPEKRLVLFWKFFLFPDSGISKRSSSGFTDAGWT